LKSNDRFLIFLTVFLLCLVSLIPSGTGELKNHFGEKGIDPEVTYELVFGTESDSAMEATGFVKLPTHRGVIKNASMKIQCKPNDQDSYLTNPSLDIGLDGDFEWMYSGKGYGKAGNQDSAF
jgi:hypothetical protein